MLWKRLWRSEMASGNDWMKSRAKGAGPPDREVRFEVAGRALGEARARNREVEEGGAGCPILVEGRKDVKALRRLGFSGTIELVNRGWGRDRLVAYLFETYGTRNPADGSASIIILMDWDRTGGRIQHDISGRLESFDVKLDVRTRMELARSMKPEGRSVESLAPHAMMLRAAMAHHDPDGVAEEEKGHSSRTTMRADNSACSPSRILSRCRILSSNSRTSRAMSPLFMLSHLWSTSVPP